MSTNIQTAVGRFVWHDHMSGDAAKAGAFYTDLLGWELEVWKPGEINYPMITANEQMHGGFGPAQGGAPPHWLGHILVEDVDEAALRAEAAGGKVVAPAMDIPEVGRMVVVADPQGAVVSLFTPAGESPASEGVFAWDELLTSNVEGAKQFYGEVVGWTARDSEMGGGNAYTLFHSGDTDRAGCMPTPEGVEAPPHWLPYLATGDVDETISKAEELGARKLMGPTDVPKTGRIAVLMDPTGAVFGLYASSNS